MAEAAKYALWLRPFGDAAFELKNRIEKLGRRFGTPVFEPHITMLSGLKRGETELVQLTDTLAGSLSPFTVELTEAGYRDHYYQSLYIHVKKTAPFINAQETAEKLFGCTTDETYFPHLSLAYGDIPEKEKSKVLNIMGRSFHISFPVHSLLLIKTGGAVEEWKKYTLPSLKINMKLNTANSSMPSVIFQYVDANDVHHIASALLFIHNQK